MNSAKAVGREVAHSSRALVSRPSGRSSRKRNEWVRSARNETDRADQPTSAFADWLAALDSRTSVDSSAIALGRQPARGLPHTHFVITLISCANVFTKNGEGISENAQSDRRRRLRQKSSDRAAMDADMRPLFPVASAPARPYRSARRRPLATFDEAKRGRFVPHIPGRSILAGRQRCRRRQRPTNRPAVLLLALWSRRAQGEVIEPNAPRPRPHPTDRPTSGRRSLPVARNYSPVWRARAHTQNSIRNA
uniref:Uncharacterized protein n=1 Tax=Plectus sambesii TaxID=2011161 RepID=A0A914WZY0_9BILA